MHVTGHNRRPPIMLLSDNPATPATREFAEVLARYNRLSRSARAVQIPGEDLRKMQEARLMICEPAQLECSDRLELACKRPPQYRDTKSR